MYLCPITFCLLFGKTLLLDKSFLLLLLYLPLPTMLNLPTFTSPYFSWIFLNFSLWLGIWLSYNKVILSYRNEEKQERFNSPLDIKTNLSDYDNISSGFFRACWGVFHPNLCLHCHFLHLFFFFSHFCFKPLLCL